MLEKILSSIEEKADEEIVQIVEEKNKAILDLQERFKEKTLKAREEAGRINQEKSKQMLEEFSQQKKMEQDFALQAEKNRIIDFVYQKAGKEISQVSESDLKKAILRLKKAMPAGISGKIKAGEKTKNILKPLMSGSLIEISGGLDEEGFIFQSPDLEIDARLSQLILEFRDQTIPQTINFLFH